MTRSGDSVGNGLNGLPMLARILALVGVPGVLVLYLVYYLTTALSAEFRQHALESRDQMEAIKLNLWVICRNVSPPAERGECRR